VTGDEEFGGFREDRGDAGTRCSLTFFAVYRTGSSSGSNATSTPEMLGMQISETDRVSLAELADFIGHVQNKLGYFDRSRATTIGVLSFIDSMEVPKWFEVG